MKTGLKVAVIFGLLGLLLLPQVVGAISLDVGWEQTSAIGLGTRDVRETIASIINVMLGLLGIVAVVIILIGGFKWMTAMGNTENVDKAKKLIFQGIIGLVIILSAYAIANFVLSSLLRVT